MSQDELWWQKSLSNVSDQLMLQLRRHYPELSHFHDDLAAQTLTDLTSYTMRYESTLPSSWFTNSDAVSENDQKHFYRLARKILRRRISDEKTKFERELATQSDFAELPRTTSAEHLILLRQMLTICARVLQDMPPETRSLLLQSADISPSTVERVSDRNRQRLSRARKNLIKTIEKELGSSIRDLLADPFS